MYSRVCTVEDVPEYSLTDPIGQHEVLRTPLVRVTGQSHPGWPVECVPSHVPKDICPDSYRNRYMRRDLGTRYQGTSKGLHSTPSVLKAGTIDLTATSASLPAHASSLPNTAHRTPPRCQPPPAQPALHIINSSISVHSSEKEKKNANYRAPPCPGPCPTGPPHCAAH